MKTAHFGSVILCVALICSMGYANQSSGDKPDQNAASAPAKTPRRDFAGDAKSNIRKPLAKRPARGSFSTSIRPRPLGRSSPSAKAELHQNETAGRSGPVRHLPAVRSSASFALSSNTRHRSLNSAVISGSGDPLKRNTVAIDGRQVHRQP